jgi:hypothetical protein
VRSQPEWAAGTRLTRAARATPPFLCIIGPLTRAPLPVPRLTRNAGAMTRAPIERLRSERTTNEVGGKRKRGGEMLIGDALIAFADADCEISAGVCSSPAKWAFHTY